MEHHKIILNMEERVVPLRALHWRWRKKADVRGFILFVLTAVLWSVLLHISTDALFANRTCAFCEQGSAF